MGSGISSKANTIPEEVAKKVEELGVLFCAVGDDEIGQRLRLICESPDQLYSLRTAILQEAHPSSHELEKPQEAAEAEKSTDELWLHNFTSKSSVKLSNEERPKILRVIQDWARHKTNSACLTKDASGWCKNPSAFCGTTPRRRVSNYIELIGFYSDEYEQIENSKRLNAVRRKVILLKTFETIQKEEQRLRGSKKRKRRKKAVPNLPVARTASYRSKGINAIAERVWGHENLSPEEKKRRRDKLKRMARYGEKWSLIRPNSLILGLGNSQFFEQQKWSVLEIEAINDFVTTIPVYSLRPILEAAMQTITEEWSQPTHVYDKPMLSESIQAQTQGQRSSHESSQPARSGMNGVVPDGIQSLLDALAAEDSINPGYTGTSGIVASTAEGTLISEEIREITSTPEKQLGESYISAASQERLEKASKCENASFNQNEVDSNPPADFYDCFDPTAPPFWTSDFYDFLNPSATSY